MPFTAENFKLVENGALVIGATPLNLYSYATTDTAAQVEAANYFNSIARQLRRGDVILSVTGTGGTPVLKQYVVTSATGATTVTVALQTTTAG
jgi:hypothetical protein